MLAAVDGGVVGALIGIAATLVLALLTFAWRMGGLSSTVNDLKKDVETLTNRLERYFDGRRRDV